MRLYGEIGREVDANLFAQELASLDGRTDTVHIHINSPGGDVVSGLSIISAMRSMTAFVHVHVDGVAASMAAVIAVAADRVSMQDYAKLMIHNPYLSDPAAKMNDKLRKALASLTDTLQTILSRRGCKKEKMASLMTAETWYTADEAKTEGLIDDVVSSQRQTELQNLTTTELLSRISNEYKSINKNDEMDLTKIAARLGLPTTATEQQILDAIQVEQTQLTGQRTALVNHYLALGEKNGTVTDKNKERMKKLAAADFDLFAEMVTEVEGDPEGAEGATAGPGDAGVKPTVQTNGRLSATLGELRAKGTGSAATDAKDWDWYQRNATKALIEMETKEPARFKKLLDEYENKMM